jgi:hypothetical protein
MEVKMKYFSTLIIGLSGLFILSLVQPTLAQPQEKKVRLSPNASVSQTIGLTDVAITYCRPGVKGRVIWGELVPYDKVWRTGANEATTISFSNDVLIEGQKLPKGKYSLHTIPTATTWTVIFNKVADQWGSYSYKQEEDALRVTVTPRDGDFQERMLFTFDKLTDNSAEIVLSWEKLQVPIKIEIPAAQ